MINEIKGTGIQNNASLDVLLLNNRIFFKGNICENKDAIVKSFLCVIDNVISCIPVTHSTIWINKYVINLPILTIPRRQSFQKH